MRIIQDGYKREFKKECNRCKTVFVYTKNDTFPIIKKERSGLRKIEEGFFKYVSYIGYLNNEYLCVRCPKCQEIIKIEMFGNIFPKSEDYIWEKE